MAVTIEVGPAAPLDLAGLMALGPILTNWAIRRGAPDPEDAVQETLIRCWRLRQRGEVPGRDLVWRILDGFIVNQVRQRQDLPLPENCAEWLAAPRSGPDDNIPASPAAARLLAGLPPHYQRAIVEMAEGYSLEETARRMGTTVWAVNGYRRRVRDALSATRKHPRQPWTPAQDAQLRACWGVCGSVSEVARECGRSRTSVRRRAGFLGLVS